MRDGDHVLCPHSEGPISRWIVDDSGLTLTDPHFETGFQDAIRRTFFGSIAGMDIGSFMRVNSLRGQSHRPDFRGLNEFADPDLLSTHLEDNEFERIVAVEDYVGTGSQMAQAADILSQLVDFDVLLCPLVIASEGVATGEEISAQSAHISFEPLFTVPPSASIPETAPARYSGAS